MAQYTWFHSSNLPSKPHIFSSFCVLILPNRLSYLIINKRHRDMSRLKRVLQDKAPILVFSSLCAGASYAVYYAHHQQIAEKKVMRQGVINDIKRDRIKQQEMQHQRQQ
ncbi:putative protein Pet117 [Plasmopara halstedii]